MTNFYIITNDLKDKNHAVTNRIKDYLTAHGRFVCDETDKVDCVLVLGGDGTLLRAAVEFAHLHAPFLGINLGSLGFLAEVDKDRVESSLDKIINGEYIIEKRMMLDGEAEISDTKNTPVSALNDIVIIGHESMQLIYFDLYVNGLKLTNFVADGLVVSTPTGSTGYNLSAGGPIVEPRADAILLTPLSAHSMRSRSIILSSDDEVMIKITYGKNNEKQTVDAVFDGHNRIVLKTDDRIRITKSKKNTSIIKISELNFFEILKQKL